MQNLLCQLEAHGLCNDQIQTVFLTIHEWLDDHYPVMATITKQAMAEQLGVKELSLPSYIIIEHSDAA
jgi:hypothetical protein